MGVKAWSTQAPVLRGAGLGNGRLKNFCWSDLFRLTVAELFCILFVLRPKGAMRVLGN
jgi:hypothetical protein